MGYGYKSNGNKYKKKISGNAEASAKGYQHQPIPASIIYQCSLPLLSNPMPELALHFQRAPRRGRAAGSGRSVVSRGTCAPRTARATTSSRATGDAPTRRSSASCAATTTTVGAGPWSAYSDTARPPLYCCKLTRNVDAEQ